MYTEQDEARDYAEAHEEQETDIEAETYKVVRFYQDPDIERETVATGLTLTEAQEWCKNPETSSSTAKSTNARTVTSRYGAWFDGYEAE
jgi:hypothetical protein